MGGGGGVTAHAEVAKAGQFPEVGDAHKRAAAKSST